MDTGQMMTVMQQMPASAAAPQIAETSLPVDPIGGAFAGLLQGMSKQKATQVADAEQRVLQGISAAGQVTLAMPEIMSDVMSALLANAGNASKQATAAQPDSSEVPQDKSLLQGSIDPESQNVMLDLNAAQLAVLFGQLQGRMPEADNTTSGIRSEGLCEIPGTSQGVTESPNSNVLAQIRTDATLQPTTQAITNAIAESAIDLKDVLSPDVSAAVTGKIPAMATIVAAKDPIAISVMGSKIVDTPHTGATVTEGDRQSLLKPVDVPRVADASPLVHTERVDRLSEASLMQVRDSLVTSIPEVAFKGSPMTSPLQPAADKLDVAGTEISTPQPEQSAIPSRATALPPTPAAAGTLVMSAQVNELDGEPLQQAANSGQQEQPQKVRSALPNVSSLSSAAVSAADGRTEPVTVRLDRREPGETQKSGQVDTAKIIAADTSGGKQAGSEENATSDRGMNGNFLSQVLQQPVKTEGSLTAGTASGTVQNAASRSDVPPEQVVQQVKDRFMNHETKPGSEQIVLRLSPEHLGELKVNLNLEGQRLKVEIVAENRMVRDSLMQHTDALKESLSRQNIKMDSFEVTTGGNGATDGGRGQGNWRELAQQRQQNAWMPDGGYHLAKQAVPQVAAYLAKSEHTMVDLHY